MQHPSQHNIIYKVLVHTRDVTGNVILVDSCFIIRCLFITKHSDDVADIGKRWLTGVLVMTCISCGIKVVFCFNTKNYCLSQLISLILVKYQQNNKLCQHLVPTTIKHHGENR